MAKLTEKEKIILQEVMGKKVVEQQKVGITKKKKGTLQRVSSSALKYV